MNTSLALLLLVAIGAEPEPRFRSELVFPLDARHNHAPGIAELPGGELIVSSELGRGTRMTLLLPQADEDRDA